MKRLQLLLIWCFACLSGFAHAQQGTSEAAFARPTRIEFKSHNVTLPPTLRFDQEFQDGLHCGPNAVYALLRLYGHPVRLADVASKIKVDDRGSDLQTLVEVLRSYGLAASARTSVSPEDLLYAPKPLIVHLDIGDSSSPTSPAGHFLVLSKSLKLTDGSFVFEGVDTANLRFVRFDGAQLARTMSGHCLIIGNDSLGSSRLARWMFRLAIVLVCFSGLIFVDLALRAGGWLGS